MRVVIYDEETYEPLTVVTIPNVYIREMEEGKRDRSLRIPIPSVVPARVDVSCRISFDAVMSSIVVRFEPICRGPSGQRFMWLCTAEDGASALLLRSTFLPGQQKDVQAIERQAYLRGVLEALA